MHFHVKEAYMKRHGYPGLAGHRAVHRDFVKEAERFRRQLNAGGNLSEVFLFLSRRLIDHIMKEDRRYMAYLPGGKENK